MGDKGLVLVSGASGYIGSHVTLELLNNGYSVRGTVRSLQRVQPHLQQWVDDGKALELVEASLLDADSWVPACEGCKFVAHVASPFFVGCKPSEAEEKLYKPARDGTLNVLRAAQKAGVEKVVLTSSIAAIYGGHPRPNMFEKPEETWTDIEAKGVEPYLISKTLAERAAWAFVEEAKEKGEPVFGLAAINPSLVFGPPVSSGDGESHAIMRKFFNREFPRAVNVHQGIVDVRDVAKSHRLALEVDAAIGKRFVCQGSSLNLIDMGGFLYKEFRQYGYKPAHGGLPYGVLWCASWWDPGARAVLSEFGAGPRDMDTSQIKDVLGMTFIDAEKTVTDHCHGCLQMGVKGFKQTKKYKKYLANNTRV